MRRSISYSLVAVLAAGALGAAEVDWQGSAKGLTEGPLCSLVLQVTAFGPGEGLDVFVPGGSLNTGWGTIGPHEIPLGSITPGGGAKVAGIRRTGDWSGGRAVVGFDDGTRITLYASRLSPGR